MLPQKPAHVSQELWELELPSILGMAHPSISVGDTDSEDFSPMGIAASAPSTPAPISTLAHPTTQSEASLAASATSLSSLAVSNQMEDTPNPAAANAAATSGPIFDVDSDTDVAPSDAQSELATLTQVYGPPAVPGGDWSEIWNMDRPAQGFITYIH